jgi:hypothetical protein
MGHQLANMAMLYVLIGLLNKRARTAGNNAARQVRLPTAGECVGFDNVLETAAAAAAPAPAPAVATLGAPVCLVQTGAHLMGLCSGMSLLALHVRLAKCLRLAMHRTDGLLLPLLLLLLQEEVLLSICMGLAICNLLASLRTDNAQDYVYVSYFLICE